MDFFDGPYFTPDLIGPDGKLSRLHKGGQGRANQLQAEANALAKRNANLQRNQSIAANRAAVRSAAADRRAALVSSKKIAAASQNAAQTLAASQADPAPTQVIQDEEALRRAKIARGGTGAAFGISSARALSQFGLGGSSGYLG